MRKYIFLIIIISVLVLFYHGVSLYGKSHSQKTIYVVSMTADEMSEALRNGTISGFVSWEPIPAKAVVDGYGRYLVNSKDIWNNQPCCVLAVSEYLKDEDTMRGLVWVQVKSTRFINDPANREKLLDYGSEFTGVNRTAISAAINNTVYNEFPDLAETKREFEIMDKSGIFSRSLTSLGYRDTDDFMESIIIDKFYRQISERLDADPSWIPQKVNGSLRFGYIDGDLHNLGVYVAQKEGYFEKIGLFPDKNIQFLKFRNGLAIANAFSHRDLDVATFGMTPLLRYRINDHEKLCIIGGLNSGGTSLVVRADSDIDTIDDLSGSTIATPGSGTVQDIVMRRMFEGFDIKAV